MSTLKEVKDLIRKVNLSGILDKIDSRFRCDLQRMTFCLGLAICEERRISAEKARRLPSNTNLGPVAELLFKRLKAQCKKHLNS